MRLSCAYGTLWTAPGKLWCFDKVWEYWICYVFALIYFRILFYPESWYEKEEIFLSQSLAVLKVPKMLLVCDLLNSILRGIYIPANHQKEVAKRDRRYNNSKGLLSVFEMIKLNHQDMRYHDDYGLTQMEYDLNL